MTTLSALGSRTIMAFVATQDASRARTFYRDTLGLRFVSEDGFASYGDEVQPSPNAAGQPGGRRERVDEPVAPQQAAHERLQFGGGFDERIGPADDARFAQRGFEPFRGMGRDLRRLAHRQPPPRIPVTDTSKTRGKSVCADEPGFASAAGKVIASSSPLHLASGPKFPAETS